MVASSVVRSNRDPVGGWCGRLLAPDELGRIFSVIDRFALSPAPRALLGALLSWRLLGRPRMPATPDARHDAEPALSLLRDAHTTSLLSVTRAAWRALPPAMCARAVDACTSLGGASLALEVVLGDPALLTPRPSPPAGVRSHGALRGGWRPIQRRSVLSSAVRAGPTSPR